MARFSGSCSERGLRQVRLVISDKSKGLISVLPEFYPDAKWQRCVFHFHKNVLHEVPTTRSREVAAMLKAIHAQESAQACRAKAGEIVEKLKEMKLRKAASVLEEGIDETLSYHDFPGEHHRSLRTNNMLERIIKELRRRTRVVGAFPDGQSALMLCCARLRYIETKSWPEDVSVLRSPSSHKRRKSPAYDVYDYDQRIIYLCRGYRCLPLLRRG
ncbi:MAG: transposase [Akkermansiaceae bacterium]